MFDYFIESLIYDYLNSFDSKAINEKNNTVIEMTNYQQEVKINENEIWYGVS